MASTSTQDFSAVPVKVVGLTRVTSIAAGDSESLAVARGTVFAWGNNLYAHGFGEEEVPVPVPGVGPATTVAADSSQSLAVVAGGKVRAWGIANTSGQLGDGTTAPAAAPVTVTRLSGVTALTAGDAGAVALAPATAAAGHVPAAVHTAAAPGPFSSPWRVTASPRPANAGGDCAELSASAVSSTDAWITGECGQNGIQGGPDQLAAQHWDGRSWHLSILPSPPGVTTGQLQGVDELSPADVWTVGNDGGNGAVGQRTLIEHFDGTRWSVIPSPDPATGPDAFDDLVSVSGSAPDNVWAEGEYSDGVTFAALLFEHWNGKKWSFVKGPDTGPQTIFGTGISVLSPSDAWATGNLDSGRIDLNFSEHWDGTKWTVVKTPSMTGKTIEQNNLTGVSAVSAGGAWASGYAVTRAGQDIAYMLHWTGAAWSLVTVPNPPGSNELNGVAAMSASDIWTAGSTLLGSPNGVGTLGLIEHFNGKRWSIVPGLDPGEQFEQPHTTVQGIAAAAPHTLFAIGGAGMPAIIGGSTFAERTTSG